MPRNLFKITRLSQSDTQYIFSAEVDPSSEIFGGHFAEMPVVPGVCTLTMIKQCVEDILKRSDVSYSSIRECKFLSAILPSEHKVLQVILELKDDGKITAEVICGEVKMMKLKAYIAKYE